MLVVLSCDLYPSVAQFDRSQESAVSNQSRCYRVTSSRTICNLQSLICNYLALPKMRGKNAQLAAILRNSATGEVITLIA